MHGPSISTSSPCSSAAFSWIPQVKRYFHFSEPILKFQNTEFYSSGTRGRTRTAKITVKTYATASDIAANKKQEPLQRRIELPQVVVVLDIEGTTTPISFVTDSLFPYARDNVRNHLMSTFESEETQADIDLLRRQAEEDVKGGIIGARLIPSRECAKEEIIEAAVANVNAMIEGDRKVTALKELQGHIWRCGFAKGELQSDVFEDVPKALLQWYNAGAKVYIYSSGSREAQRLIFGNTQYGDLRPFLSGYFDTVTAGNKRESRSYKEIYLSVGVDEPAQIVFATDVLQEAIAARDAGLRTVIVVRPGNAHLPAEHDFKAVTTLLEI